MWSTSSGLVARLESRSNRWLLCVEGADAAVEVDLSPSVVLLKNGSALDEPLKISLPLNARCDPQSASVRRSRDGGQLLISWPISGTLGHSGTSFLLASALPPALVCQDHAANHANEHEANARASAAKAPQQDSSMQASQTSIEAKFKAFKESCRELDKKYNRMNELYAEMNNLAREKLAVTNETKQLADIEGQDYLAQLPDGLRVDEDLQVGRCLVADRPWEAGSVLLRELPAIIVPMECLTPGDRKDLLSSWEALDSRQRALLHEFVAHLDLAREEDRLRLTLSDDELAEMKLRGLTDACHDSLLRWRMAVRVNAHCFGYGAALFIIASKATHSCCPNCRAIERDGAIELWTLRDLDAGEQITISYIQEELDLLACTPIRRRHLWEKFCFLCVCSRCTEPDRARCFVCAVCGSGGFQAVEPSPAITPLGPKWEACDQEAQHWSCSGACADEAKMLNEPCVTVPVHDVFVVDCLAREKDALTKWGELKTAVGIIAAKMLSVETFLALAVEECRHTPTTRWEDLWNRVCTFQEELAFSAEHWVAAQASLLKSELALVLAAKDGSLPIPESDVVGGVRKFICFVCRVCPGVSYALDRLVTDVVSVLTDYRNGTLEKRLRLLSGTANILGEFMGTSRKNALHELD